MNGSRIADEFLAEEMGVDYDEYTSDKNLPTKEDFQIIDDVEKLRNEFVTGSLITRDNHYIFSNNEAIEIYKKICFFYSPNVKRVTVTSKHYPIFPNSIIFYCERYVGSDLVFSQVVFDFDFNVVKINNYDKQYLKS